MKTSLYKTLVAAAVLSIAPLVQAQISVSIGIAPPALPVYAQPDIPGDGYLWTPGYWSWNANDNDYFWIPGTWVAAPFVGALWTPGYWGFDGNRYAWNNGYWGQHIGYYGGINYGFGYTGVGYQGGYWDHGSFSYNRTVNNIRNTHVTNIYSSNVINNQHSHVSFNGGRNGVQMTASKNEELINSMPHNRPTEGQAQHETDARGKPDLRFAVNHGSPKIAATPELGSFNSPKAESSRIEQVRVAHVSSPNRPNNGPAHEDNHQNSRPAPNQNQARHAAPEREEEHRK